eukprot:404539_1
MLPYRWVFIFDWTFYIIRQFVCVYSLISALPTEPPSKNPSIYPTVYPSKNTSIYPSGEPSTSPTVYPTGDPSLNPSIDPTAHPNSQTIDPTVHPLVDSTSLSVYYMNTTDADMVNTVIVDDKEHKEQSDVTMFIIVSLA